MKPSRTIEERIAFLREMAGGGPLYDVSSDTAAAIAAVLDHVQELRDSHARLHRRCQRAEAAAEAKIARPEYRAFGRAILVYSHHRAAERADELEKVLLHVRALALAGGHLTGETQALAEIADYAGRAAGQDSLTPPAGGQEC